MTPSDIIPPASGGAGSSAQDQQASLFNGVERDTFLRLLVSQLRNQDPLNPQDPTEFVTQLAQFSSLETLLEMRNSLQAIEQGLSAPAPGTSASTET